ncbi:MAG TPA: hypothetical protein VGV92_04105 [Gammaproteobacteria bacterium]|nr:hypothetical protein [Gammaproteobacteria bacterium]
MFEDFTVRMDEDYAAVFDQYQLLEQTFGHPQPSFIKAIELLHQSRFFSRDCYALISRIDAFLGREDSQESTDEAPDDLTLTKEELRKMIAFMNIQMEKTVKFYLDMNDNDAVRAEFADEEVFGWFNSQASARACYASEVSRWLPGIKSTFEKLSNDVECFKLNYTSAVNYPGVGYNAKLELLSDYCLETLASIQSEIELLKEFRKITDTCLRIIYPSETRTNMAKKFGIFESMLFELTSYLVGVEKSIKILAELYPHHEARLPQKLKNFIVPWLDPKHPEPLKASIAALKACKDLPEEPNAFISSNAQNETQALFERQKRRRT